MKIIVSCQMSRATEMRGSSAIADLPEWKRIHDHLEHPYKLGLIACAMRVLEKLATLVDGQKPDGTRPWASQIVAAIDYAEHAKLTLSIDGYNGAGGILQVGSWLFGMIHPAEVMSLWGKGVEHLYGDEATAMFLFTEIKNTWANLKAKRKAA